MRKIVSRPDVNRIPGLPLPFHVRSVGCNEAECGWSERIPGRLKKFFQLFWTAEGCGELMLPEGGSVLLPAGSVFLRHPDEEHWNRTSGASRWRYYWFTADGPGAEAFFCAYGYPREALRAGECPVRLFLELELMLKRRTPYAQRHALSVAAEILALAGRKSGEEDSSENSGSSAAGNVSECGGGGGGSKNGGSLVKAFIDLAHETFSDPASSVGTLSAGLGVHRTTLNRVFSREMAMSPGTYLHEIRIQRAFSLLQESSLPLKEIAFRCGFGNASYLCRLVRKVTGLPPSEYRKRAAMD